MAITFLWLSEEKQNKNCMPRCGFWWKGLFFDNGTGWSLQRKLLQTVPDVRGNASKKTMVKLRFVTVHRMMESKRRHIILFLTQTCLLFSNEFFNRMKHRVLNHPYFTFNNTVKKRRLFSTKEAMRMFYPSIIKFVRKIRGQSSKG